MRLVIVESPFAGCVTRNIEYARACMADCLQRGEAPLASHLLYTQPGVLDDSIPEQRAIGMDAGREWMLRADAVVVYDDYGVSTGMWAGIFAAINSGKPVEYRTLLTPLTPRAESPAPGALTAEPPRNGSAMQRQVGGSHYRDMKIQPMEYILANNVGFVEGCVIKYVSRWRAKNGLEDLRKARHNLDILIEHEEGAQ